MEHVGTPKRRGKAVRIFLGALVVIALLVALAPTILSMGIARSIARNAIGDAINGKADLGGVSLGWFSSQAVSGLDVRDDSGENAATVDVSVNSGLLALATSGGSSLDVALSGVIKGTIEKDGSLGFQKLAKPSTSGGGSAGGGGSGSGGKKGGGSGSDVAGSVSIKNLSVTILDKRSGKTYALLTALNGNARFDGKARTANVQLASPTDLSGAKGSIELKVDLGKLPLAGNLGAMTIDLSLAAKDVKVPAGGVDAEFRTIECAVKSPGLGERVTVSAKAEGLVDGKTPSTLNVDLAAVKLIGADDAVEFNPANVVGSIEATNLPTSLVQPSLAATDIVASEDIGPIIQRLVVRAPGGTGEKIVVELATEKASLSIAGLVDPNDRSLRQGTLDGKVRATPATLKRVAKTDVLGEVELALAGRELSWSASTAARDPLANFVGTIEIQPQTPITWRQAEPAAPPVKGGTSPIAVALGPTTKIVLSRDAAGKPLTLDTKAAIGLGSAAAPPTAPSAPNLSLSSAIAAGLKGVENATLTSDLPLEPAFLLAVSGRSFTKATRLTIDVRDVDYTMSSGNPLAGLSLDASVALVGETSMYVEQLNRDVPLRDISVRLSGADLSKEAVVAVKGAVDAAVLDIKETVRNLPSNMAGIDPLALDLRGTARISGLDGDSLVAWLGQHREAIESAGIKDLSIDLSNEPAGGAGSNQPAGQKLALTLTGEPVHGSFAGTLGAEGGSIERLEFAGALPEALLEAVQSSPESKVELAKNVPFTLTLGRPTAFRFAELKDGKLPAGLSARLTVTELAVRSAPGLHGGLTVEGLDLLAEVDPSATSAKAKGGFALRGTTGPNARVEKATLDVAWVKQTAPSLLQGVSGEVKLDGVNVPWIESLLGKDAGAYSKWTGDDGSLALTLGREGKTERIQLVPRFPRIVAGTIGVVADGQRVEASAKGLAVRVPAASLTELAARPAPKQAATAAANDATTYSFQSDLALTLADASVVLPNGLAKEGNAVAGGSVNISLATDPVALQSSAPGRPSTSFNVPAIDLAVTSADILKGVTLRAKDRGQGAAGQPTFRIDGSVIGLADASGAFSAEGAKLDLDADVHDIPTVLIDLVASMNGKLSRSLGESIAVKANAKGLSKTSGNLSASVKAPFADLDVPQVAIDKNGIARIAAAKPLTATFAMSPGIKEDILYAINTIFVDVDLVKERASLTVKELGYPLDGNLAKLDGDINLDVGEVRLQNGQPASIILKLLNNAASGASEGGSEGRIEPLAIKIANGRLTYDKFGLKLFKLATAEGSPAQYANAIDMKGDVDLAKMVVNAITTKIPLSQFANYSGDVNSIFAKIGGRDSDLAKSLTVGVTISGPLYDEKGKAKELSQKLDMPGIEDVAKNPENLLKVLPGLLDLGGSGGAKQPAMPAKDGGTKEEKPAAKPATKPSEPAKPKDGATKPAAPAKPKDAATKPATPAKPKDAATKPAEPAKPKDAATKPAEPAKPKDAATKPAAPAKPKDAATKPAAPAKPKDKEAEKKDAPKDQPKEGPKETPKEAPKDPPKDAPKGTPG